MLHNKPADYVAAKVDVLDDLGLHNRAEVERRLRIVEKSVVGNNLEAKIDRAARTMLFDFYDGDRTCAFVAGVV